jgi:hypothetical protein
VAPRLAYTARHVALTSPRVWRPLLCGVIAAALTAADAYLHPERVTDFEQVWFAARELLAGNTPYGAIGPGRTFDWPWPFVYPLTTVVSVLPLALVPAPVARTLFLGLSVGLLALAFRDRPLLPVIVGAPFVNAFWNVQWSIILTAAMVLPWLGWLAPAKPTLGVALLTQARSRRQLQIAIGGGLALVLISLTLRPGWPGEWLVTLREGPRFIPPLLRPGGLLLLAAALRWKEPEGRLILALAVTPQTAMWYEALPLFLVPRSLAEGKILAFTSQLAFFSTALMDVPAEWAGRTRIIGMLMLAGCYFPALIMVLRRRRLPG